MLVGKTYATTLLYEMFVFVVFTMKMESDLHAYETPATIRGGNWASKYG